MARKLRKKLTSQSNLAGKFKIGVDAASPEPSRSTEQRGVPTADVKLKSNTTVEERRFQRRVSAVRITGFQPQWSKLVPESGKLSEFARTE